VVSIIRRQPGQRAEVKVLRDGQVGHEAGLLRHEVDTVPLRVSRGERLGALTVDQGRQVILLESLEGDENSLEVRIHTSAGPVEVAMQPR
jgi:hypothetical protein